MSKHHITFLVMGLIHLLLASAIVLIMWKGGWALNTESQRIEVLSKALLYSFAIDALYGAGMLLATPLRNILFKAGPVEANLNGDTSADT